MMIQMYSMNEIKRLQVDKEYREQQEDNYCLVSLQGKKLSKKDVENQCNFCILQVLNAYEQEFISARNANFLIETIETYEYTYDLLGAEKIISKLNTEIISEALNTPFFNSLCVVCSDLYDGNF